MVKLRIIGRDWTVQNSLQPPSCPHNTTQQTFSNVSRDLADDAGVYAHAQEFNHEKPALSLLTSSSEVVVRRFISTPDSAMFDHLFQPLADLLGIPLDQVFRFLLPEKRSRDCFGTACCAGKICSPYVYQCACCHGLPVLPPPLPHLTRHQAHCLHISRPSHLLPLFQLVSGEQG